MYVCMYVCKYVCMYVGMYVCIHYVCTYAHTYVRMHVLTYVCMYVCMYVCRCICMYVRMYICMNVCVCVFCAAGSLTKTTKSAWSCAMLFQIPTSNPVSLRSVSTPPSYVNWMSPERSVLSRIPIQQVYGLLNPPVVLYKAPIKTGCALWWVLIGIIPHRTVSFLILTLLMLYQL